MRAGFVRSMVVAAVGTAALALPAAAGAQLPLGPLNDLGALSQGEGQTPDPAPIMRRAEPPLVATPAPASCAPGSHPEPGVDGRVPAGSGANGLSCNATQVAHQGTSGGFKTLQYTDPAGHTCVYYDTALLFPTNAINLAGPSLGVTVLDMDDPDKPVQTDTLTELPMMSPHESLVVNQKRGILAADLGNPATYPGDVSFYDVATDCRHPKLDFTGVIARLGHESGFSPDGRTFYATGTATRSITAIDVTDPKNPHPIWQGNVLSHGMSLSDDGNRAYVADAGSGDMAILDTSQIQARKPNPQVREVSRLTWNSASIPQNALPFTEDGHPYVLEFDEYTAGTLGMGSKDAVGAGRIIDIADETQPRVVANLRLQVDQAADHAAATAANDPGTTSPAQGYAAHYCNIPSRVDPKIVACSFIASGLRVFDISDLLHPKEIAYFVAPTQADTENGYNGSDYAMSQPTFDMARHEVWYTDGGSGFYNVRIDPSVWPSATPATAPVPAGRVCSGRRRFTATLVVPRGARIRSARATLAGRGVHATRRGRRVSAVVDLRGSGRLVAKLVIRVRLRSGRTVATTRTYHPCTRRA